MQFDHTNADRLVYLTDRPETPFADNMSAWLREGYLDREGKTVETRTGSSPTTCSSPSPTPHGDEVEGLPNHPTAPFPDRWRALDGNPN